MTETLMMASSAGAAIRSRLALFGLLAVSMLASSCDKKNVAAPGDGVEGVLSESQLIAWRDTPTQDSVFADLAPSGPGPEDTLISVHDIYAVGPGYVQGMIFDYTAADRFEVFRLDGGSFRPFKDFAIAPSKRYFKGATDVFRFLDTPGGSGSRDYVARGLLDGIGVASAPKTNVAASGSGPVALDLRYTGPTGVLPDLRPLDSLLVMTWDPYPGAAGYWVHVYQLTNQGGEDIVRSGTPAPAYIAVTRDYLLAYLPGGTTSYRWGDPVPAGGRIVTSIPLLNGLDFLVRVSAVDASGQFIAYTGTTGSYGVFRSEATYRKFPLGAVQVHTRRFVPPPGGTEPARLLTTSNPRLSIAPTSSTPHR
jgi:hypothetical protein